MLTLSDRYDWYIMNLNTITFKMKACDMNVVLAGDCKCNGDHICSEYGDATACVIIDEEKMCVGVTTNGPIGIGLVCATNLKPGTSV